MARKYKHRRVQTRRKAFSFNQRGVSMFVVVVLIVLVSAAVVRFSKDDSAEAGLRKAATSQLPALAFNDKVGERAVSELRSFGQWLRDNNAAAFIGETGWPNRPDDGAQWNAVADSWYNEARYHDVWVTAWAAGSWWGGYPLAIYGHTAGERKLDTARSQASVVEKYPTKDGQLRGVNLAGMEFGTEDSFTNVNPGTAGQSYFYEPAESMKYLASRGVKLVRLPVRWERMQPVLGGALKDTEVQATRSLLDAASANGIKVVIDLHNYGVYSSGSGKLLLGTTLPHDKLVDVWQRLSAAFKGHDALAAYGIMNEPHDLPTGDYNTPAKNWEAASQRALTALRNSGDNTLVMVAGYDWSSTARWVQNHPTGWVEDPANNFRYEAHHYWDSDGSGTYQATFAQELTNH